MNIFFLLQYALVSKMLKISYSLCKLMAKIMIFELKFEIGPWTTLAKDVLYDQVRNDVCDCQWVFAWNDSFTCSSEQNSLGVL